MGFLSNSGPDPYKNHKATKPAFNVSPSLAAGEMPLNWRFAGIIMVFRWRARDDGPLLALFGPSLP